MLNSRMSLVLALLITAVIPLAASGATIQVPDQYATIASAIAAANSGDEIRISSGVYEEHDLVLPTNVSLVGEGESPADCVIDGQGQGRILTIQFLDGPITIRNLTLVNGHASGETSYDCSGGAVFINSSLVTIDSCRFQGNSAEYSGGAVRCMGADLDLSDCWFENNSAVKGGGALDLSYGASGQIDAVTFVDNRADYGGAFACRGDSNPTVSGCTFSSNLAEGNQGDGGGALTFFYSYPEFVRCVFRENSATYGGAIYNDTDATANLSYCTLLQNTALQGGGGVFIDNAEPAIENSLVVFQTGDAVGIQGNLTPMISCTDIFGNSRGDWVGGIDVQFQTRGNLSVDPLFCSLDPNSPPVLQVGSPATLEGGACDDLGALGVGCLSGVGDGDPGQTPPLTRAVENLGVWPNPFNPTTRVHFELGVDQRVKLDVYGIDGRRVRRLADEVYSAGSWDVTWNGVDDRGRSVASGSYVIVVSGETTTRRVKVTLLK